MRSVHRSVFFCLVLATMTLLGVSVLPKPAEAWVFATKARLDGQISIVHWVLRQMQ